MSTYSALVLRHKLKMDCISHLIDWKILSSRQHNTDTMRIQRTVANVW